MQYLEEKASKPELRDMLPSAPWSWTLIYHGTTNEKARNCSISVPLAHIINLSLGSGVVPDQMKTARIIPLFKSGVHSLVTNYRPVPVLPVFF